MKRKHQYYYQTVHRMLCTSNELIDQVNKALKPFGISEPQYNVLRILVVQQDPITVQEIQKKMIQKSSNITRIIDKLIDKSLVNREICPMNRRKMDIVITNDGKKILQKLDIEVYKIHEPFIKNLTEKEIKILSDLLKKLNKKI